MNDNYLETKSVCKYFGGLKALDNIDLSINKKQLKAIIGPNGAGKTTFFNLISGLYPPTKGKIFFEGVDITNKGMHKISKIGITKTFQITHIFPSLTVFENVRLAAQSRTTTFNFLRRTESLYAVNNAAREVLEQVHLVERAGVKASELSHGERRYLEIGIALATNPKILLLDEPAAGMNPAETLQVTELVRSLVDKLGLTVILIEHDMKVVMAISDEIMVLKEGRTLATGTPKEISSNEEVQRAYLGGRN